MTRLRSTIRLIDNYTELSGQCLAWLCLAMTLMTCTVVLLRYGFGIGSVAAQESITYMHATLFMLAAAFTLKRGSHVRVDIFYRRFSERNRAWINSIGAIVFLLPFSIFILGVSWQFVGEAWAVQESSQDPGGIPGVYLLKTLILLMAVNLLLQGLAEIFRNALVLLGDEA
ncbi:MAG: TRAP transporter small permease subunit [Gammaproteobacteria bacterium]|nr:TRAP transporter small permease subunit [Gammaproteobacteria bacterium]